MRANRVLGFAAALALLVAVGAAAVVWAHPAAMRSAARYAFAFGRLAPFGHVARQLNLTTEQRQQIRDIVKGRKADIKRLLDERFAAGKALRQAIAADNNDAMTAAINRLSAAELKAARLRAELRAKIFNDVLRAEQRSKADDLLSKFEQRADRRRERIERFLDKF